jgi:apolipoprotein N-acyltransferase
MDQSKKRYSESRPSQAANPGSSPAIDRSAWLLAFGSGILQILIFPLPGLSFLAWIAVAPLLLAVIRARRPVNSMTTIWTPASPRQAFALGYLAGVVSAGGSCYWVFNVMYNYGGLSAPTAAALLLLFCLTLGLFLGIFAALLGSFANSRLRARAILLAPVLWVAVELLRGYAVDFPWNPLGNVLVDNIPLSRIATVTGVYGLSFEIMLMNVAFAMAFLVPHRQRIFLLAGTFLGSALLQAGVLFPPPHLAAEGTALLVQSDVPILDPGGWTTPYFQQTLAELSSLSVPQRGELMPGVPKPSLIVWPESPAPLFVNDPQFRQTISAIASQTQATVVAGSLGQPIASPGKLFNSAAVVAPDGTLAARYDKIHLVPFGEYVPFQRLLSFASKLTREVGDFIPGSERKPVIANGIPLGIFICYEAVFPNDVRQFAKNGAQLFVNISNDGWFGETSAPLQHFNMARMRAIENNRWLLRGTNTGITAAIDPFGRVVAQAAPHVRTSLDAPFGLIAGTTFYTRHGDWFAYACAIISLGFIGGLILSRGRVIE